MAISKDEPSVGKADARSGQWVDITMKKVHILLSMIDGDNRKHVLDYNVDLMYVVDQRKNMTCSTVTLDQLLSKQVPGNIVKALGGKDMRKENNFSKEVLFSKADVSTSEFAPIITSDSKDNSDIQKPLPPLPKLTRVDPSGASKSLISLSDLTANMVDLTLNNASKEMKKSSNKVSQTYVNKKKTKTQHPAVQNSCPDKIALPSTKKLLLTLMEELKVGNKGLISSNQNPLKSGFTKGTNMYKNVCAGLPKEESGPKVVSGDNSSGDTEDMAQLTIMESHSPRLSEPFSMKNMKLFSLLPEEEMFMLLTCHLSTKIAMLVSLPNLYQLKMENLNEVRVKELGSDNGTEFKNHKLEELCDENGISQNFSTPCTPEQNGVAERRNRTLTETARTIGRSPDINYFHVFRCPVHIHNHRDHLGKFDEKADDGFFLGYSSVAKAFRVFNIRRQEMEEIVHITFSEDDEAISQTSTEGDAINFNENRSFPDDEFIEPRSKDTQCFVNIEYFCYVSAYENITLAVLPTLQNFVTSKEPREFMITDNLPDTHEHDHAESADILESDEPQDNVLSESISDDQLALIFSPSAKEGIDYEETFAPVARLEAIRIFLTVGIKSLLEVIAAKLMLLVYNLQLLVLSKCC
ncbi:retrovirus-related pol polyprotein from transposon TNT 1-94 [Tanacetum coccineum]